MSTGKEASTSRSSEILPHDSGGSSFRSSMSVRTRNGPRSSSSCRPDSAAAESGRTHEPAVATGHSSTWYGTAMTSSTGSSRSFGPTPSSARSTRVRDLRHRRGGDGELGASLAGGVPAAPQPRREHERWREVPQARLVVQNPQRPYAEHGHLPVKRWSDPRGDTGSQAEQKRPGRRAAPPLGGNRRVGPYPPWA